MRYGLQFAADVSIFTRDSGCGAPAKTARVRCKGSVREAYQVLTRSPAVTMNELERGVVTVTFQPRTSMSAWREPGLYRTHDPVKHMLVRVRLRKVTTASASRAPARREDDAAIAAPAATISSLTTHTHAESGIAA